VQAVAIRDIRRHSGGSQTPARLDASAHDRGAKVLRLLRRRGPAGGCQEHTAAGAGPGQECRIVRLVAAGRERKLPLRHNVAPSAAFRAVAINEPAVAAFVGEHVPAGSRARLRLQGVRVGRNGVIRQDRLGGGGERQSPRSGVCARGLAREHRDPPFGAQLELKRCEALGKRGQVVEVQHTVLLVLPVGDEQSRKPGAGFRVVDLFRAESSVQEIPFGPVHVIERHRELAPLGVLEECGNTHLRCLWVRRPAPVVAIDPQRDCVERARNGDGGRREQTHFGRAVGGPVGQFADVAAPDLLLARSFECGHRAMALNPPAFQVLEVHQGWLGILQASGPIEFVGALAYAFAGGRRYAQQTNHGEEEMARFHIVTGNDEAVQIRLARKYGQQFTL